METTVERARFVIVGSGWRAMYYVRIAKALPERFELCAMLCRTQEKAELIRSQYGIPTSTSVEECRKLQPDFVVVAVNKASIAEVSMQWMNLGITVLCETPAALDRDKLEQLWRLHRQGKKLVVAEQYTSYPQYQAMLRLIHTGILGEPDALNLSLAHEYHGASLMRAFLQEPVSAPFAVSAHTYEFDTVETLSRYERFTDGRSSRKKRTVATFSFADGKVAWYDFDSEQYRSPIRPNYVKVQGCKGVLKDDHVYYLDADCVPQEGMLKSVTHKVVTGDSNPNLAQIKEYESIRLWKLSTQPEQEEGTVLYEPEFGLCGLSDDETAIAHMMWLTAQYAYGAIDLEEDLRNALQDSYMAILMSRAVATGAQMTSEPQIWQ